MTHSNNILDEDIFKPSVPRRKLLPWWIRFFCWVFMIMGAFIPIGLIIALLGVHFEIAIYGIETYDPLSALGLLLITVVLFKSITAFGLWTEKDWAISAGITDANIGIIICLFEMAILPLISDTEFKFRLEIILLIPYLFKLLQIRKAWAGENK